MESLEGRQLLSASLKVHSAPVIKTVVGQLGTATSVSASTVPANGDVNPYGLAFVPEGFAGGGPLHAGDLLVSNFNDSSNGQGSGTTIVRVTPAGATSTFFQGPSGLGLTTALSVLKSGFVVVGNMPTTDGTSATVQQGSLIILNKFGLQVAEFSNAAVLNGPWDMTVNDQGNHVQLFISNVLSGTVERIDLRTKGLDSALGAWRGVGAASTGPSTGAGIVTVSFSATGAPGILRPEQPSDSRPVPVLADPQTAASAGPGGSIALTVDGLPVTARVVGVLSRFPALPRDAAGFVVADEATLAGALDAQLPGQGRADELWIATAHPAPLRAALGTGALTQLDSAFRADVDQQLLNAPVARGVLGTLIAATVLSVLLAAIGLLAALRAGARDRRVETDLVEQGVGARGLRAELRTRLALSIVLGVAVGLGVAVLLTQLAVASVRAAGTVADPSPPVIPIVPWPQLVAWAAVMLAVLAVAGGLGTRAQAGP